MSGRREYIHRKTVPGFSSDKDEGLRIFIQQMERVQGTNMITHWSHSLTHSHLMNNFPPFLCPTCNILRVSVQQNYSFPAPHRMSHEIKTFPFYIPFPGLQASMIPLQPHTLSLENIIYLQKIKGLFDIIFFHTTVFPLTLIHLTS